MRELSRDEQLIISGGFHLHFNALVTVFTAIGATILGGPAAGGMVVAAALAAQGTGNLVDMARDEFGNPVQQ